jgi:hypothetical protein
MNSPTTDPAPDRKPRGPLVLNRPAKLTLAGATLAKATRSRQVHVLPADTTTTLCGIATERWAKADEVAAGGKITCPICARLQKQGATTE